MRWYRSIRDRLPPGARARAVAEYLATRAALLARRLPPFDVRNYPPVASPLVVSIHAGFWELGAWEVARRSGGILILLRPPAGALDRMAQGVREGLGLKSASLDQIARSRLPAGFMIDRDPRGEPATLLGRPILLSRIPWAIARRTGRPVIPAFVSRRGRWRAEFGDRVHDVAEAARWFDARLREDPSAWFPAVDTHPMPA